MLSPKQPRSQVLYTSRRVGRRVGKTPGNKVEPERDMPIPAQANAPYLGSPYSSTPVSVKEKPCVYSKRQFTPRD